MKTISNKLIKDYIQNKCTPQQLEELAMWGQENVENEAMLFQLKDIYNESMHHEFDDVHAIEQAEKRLFTTIHAKRHTQRKTRIVHLIRHVAVWTALLILTGVGLYAFFGNEHTITIATTAESIREVTLPDGTKVWLNINSQLTYPEAFSSQQRNVKLIGEALFEVTHNASQPFVVSSNDVSVSVLGTTFNMNTRASAHTEEVALIDGKVEVKELSTSNNVQLIPNQKVFVDKKGHHMQVAHVYAALDAVWHDNLIPFKNMNMREITSILERVYGVQISITGFKQNKTYSGVIERQHDIDSVLQNLSYTIPFHITHKPNGSIELSNK